MTREESIKLVKEVAGMSLDWDDAHYDALQMAIKALEKESRSAIVKNDLAVREFEEIVVEYPLEDLCTYPEYKVKPYFSIKYKEGNEHFIGYGTYKPEVFSRYLRDYFMPSIRPKGHWISVDKTHSECDQCGAVFEIVSANGEANYCPNCGAETESEE